MRRLRRRRSFSTFDNREQAAARRLEPFLALLLGLTLGLWIAWGLAPRGYLDPSPAALRADYKDEYRLLIASAYAATGDLNRARVRLSLLHDDDPAAVLLEQSQRALAAGDSPQTVFLLSALAEAIRRPVAQSSPFQETASPSPLVQPSATPPAFRLVVQQAVCDAKLPAGLVQIEVRDNAKQPLPGVAVWVSYGEERQILHTGLKPELGAGYADFIMQPGIEYSVEISSGGENARGLNLHLCTDERGISYWGGYLLIFEQK